ncbi:MAG: hypothetical protein OXE17_09780 [Chloroflexi bacterium]|nr:hypothetical protein [Chloroflexota bacterium]
MQEAIAQGMNIYYRGYVVHEDVPKVCYTIYDRRPDRVELATVGTSREAMKWVDCRIAIEEKLRDTRVTVDELLSLARSAVVVY